jgi:hypothetical protein
VFLSKSAEVIENKGRESEKKMQESLRVRKRKEGKEITGVKEVEVKISARFVGGSGESIGVRRWFAVGGLGGRFFRLASVASPRSGANGVSRSSAHFTR